MALLEEEDDGGDKTIVGEPGKGRLRRSWGAMAEGMEWEMGGRDRTWTGVVEDRVDYSGRWSRREFTGLVGILESLRTVGDETRRAKGVGMSTG